jgi:hypothetical protein
VVLATLIVAIGALTGCGTRSPVSSGAAPTGLGTAGPSPTTSAETGPGSSIFAPTDAALNQLVTSQAVWHTPTSLKADETSRIGLSVGQSANLTGAINSLLPSTSAKPAGSISVGPKISATLEVDADDATVNPSTAINESTGSDIQLLWTWYLHPSHPTDDLQATAHIEVVLSDGTVFSTDEPLSIQVDRTFSYTVGQVFETWETWASIGAAFGGGFLWLWRRRSKLGAIPAKSLPVRRKARALPPV